MSAGMLFLVAMGVWLCVGAPILWLCLRRMEGPWLCETDQGVRELVGKDGEIIWSEAMEPLVETRRIGNE